jgi:hypothetical protein
MNGLNRILILIAALALALPLAAQDAPAESPAVDEAPAVVDETPAVIDEAPAAPVRVVANVLFQRELNKKGNATYGDLYRLAVMLWRARLLDEAGTRTAHSPADARQALIEGGLIDASWDAGDGLLMHKDAALLFARAMDLQGGVMWSLTDSCRYAHREMIDRRLFPVENPRQYISGAGVLSAFRDCRVYLDNQLE